MYFSNKKNIHKIGRYLVLFAIVLSLLACSSSRYSNEIDIKKSFTPNGLPFYYVKNSGQDQVSINLLFRGGMAHDLNGPQVTRVALELMLQHSNGMRFGELKEELHDLRGGIQLLPSSEWSYVSIVAPKNSINQVVTLANRVLVKPDFPPYKLKQFREDTAVHVESGLHLPDTDVLRKFLDVLVEPHPISINYIGDPQRIRAITRSDLMDWHKQRIVKKNTLITVIGDLSEQKMAQLIDKVMQGLPSFGSISDLPQIYVREISEAPHIVATSPTNQAIIMLGNVISNGEDINRWLGYTLINNILSLGLKSRLHRGVREQTGKTYGFQSQFKVFTQIGVFVLSGKLAKDSIEQTLSAIQQTLDTLKRDGPNENEIKGAKTAMLSLLKEISNDNQSLGMSLTDYFSMGWSRSSIRNLPMMIENIDLTDPIYRDFISDHPIIVIAE